MALIAYVAVINAITFFFYMVNKGIAAGYNDMGIGHWRIAEFVLLLLIFLGGSFDAWLGVIFSKRKIHKRGFICFAVSLSPYLVLLGCFYG